MPLSLTELLSPMTSPHLYMQLAALLTLAAGIGHWAPGNQRFLLATVALYGAALFLLISSNLAVVLGWIAGNTSWQHIALLLLGISLIRMGGAFVFRVLLPGFGLQPPSILEDLVVFAGYLIWALVRLSQVGFDLGSILTTSAVLTAIVAISLQDTLGNILGGTALQLDNSLAVGDWIQLGNTVGRVVDIRWRSTLIETRDWETVVMPNAVLMKTEFSILGRRTGQPVKLRRWVRFNVSFQVPPQRVIDLVESTLLRARIDAVAPHPAPNCVVTSIEGSTVSYALRYWLTDLHVDDPTDSAVRLRIFTAFQRAGIAFAFPEQTLHIIKEDEQRELQLQSKERNRRIQTLRKIELFSALSDEERAELAEHLIYAPFLAGETITKQGDVAHWLYLLVSGEVEIVLQSDGVRRRVGNITAGSKTSIFGETGLLTGAPRSANVIALTDVECYRLNKTGFEHILQARPAIANDLSDIMARRKANLSQAQDDAAKSRKSQELNRTRSEILSSIRHFFHLDLTD